MRSIYETVFFKRSPEEMKSLCKKPGLVPGSGFSIDGVLKEYRLYNTGTGDVKYTWDKGRSRLQFKEWFTKYCPKAAENYTLGQFTHELARNPFLHLSLAIIWVAVSSYITYYKVTKTITEEEETALAAGLIVSSLVFHFFLYRFLYSILFFSFRHTLWILPLMLLLLNPITLPSLIVLLNLSKVDVNGDAKEILWKASIGCNVLYSILGFMMGFFF